jgi:AraC-like DNA-binding protein
MRAAPAVAQPGAIAAHVLARVLAYARTRGIDTAAACRHVGIDHAALERPDARVSYALAEALGTHVEALAGDDNFGLHLGQLVIDSIEHDPAVLAMMASPDVRSALEKMQQTQRFWGDGARAQLCFDADRGATFRWTSPMQSPRARRHADECAMAEFVSGLRALAGPHLRAQRVRFVHPAPVDAAEHRAFFLCPIEFDATHTELSLDAATLDAPMPNANARFEQVFDRQVARAIDQLGTSEDLVSRVRAEVRASLRSCSLDRVARALHTSARSLQRRLSDAETSFAAIVDDARRDAALDALSRGASIAEVSDALGYADSSAFSHAFKRWTGTTPERARAPK